MKNCKVKGHMRKGKKVKTHLRGKLPKNLRSTKEDGSVIVRKNLVGPGQPNDNWWNDKSLQF